MTLKTIEFDASVGMAAFTELCARPDNRTGRFSGVAIDTAIKRYLGAALAETQRAVALVLQHGHVITPHFSRRRDAGAT